jgi:hypothetical protein
VSDPNLIHDFISCQVDGCDHDGEHCHHGWCGAPRNHPLHTCYGESAPPQPVAAQEKKVLTAADIAKINEDKHSCGRDCDCQCGTTYLKDTWEWIIGVDPRWRSKCKCLPPKQEPFYCANRAGGNACGAQCNTCWSYGSPSPAATTQPEPKAAITHRDEQRIDDLRSIFGVAYTYDSGKNCDILKSIYARAAGYLGITEVQMKQLRPDFIPPLVISIEPKPAPQAEGYESC